MSECLHWGGVISLNAGHVSFRKEEDQLVVAFGGPLPQGGAVLWISFQYGLKEGLSGFYRQAAAAMGAC